MLRPYRLRNEATFVYAGFAGSGGRRRVTDHTDHRSATTGSSHNEKMRTRSEASANARTKTREVSHASRTVLAGSQPLDGSWRMLGTAGVIVTAMVAMSLVRCSRFIRPL